MTHTASNRRFTSKQRRIFTGCFLIYASAYVARLNLAAALPDIMRQFSLTDAQGGLIQTLFALVYAAGQLINGSLVDRISAKRYIIAGLIASAACNLLFSLSRAYWQILILWALNGAAQSMLWTPIVKLIAGWFEGKKRITVSFWISTTLILGHFAAWAISGYMAQLVSWRYSFAMPALVLMTAMLIAAFLLEKPGAKPIATHSGEHTAKAMPIRPMIFGTGLWLVLICCMANGFVRDGIMTWAPTILAGIQSGSQASTSAGTAAGEAIQTQSISATTLSLIIPAINLLGVLLGQLLLRKSAGNVRGVILLMMAAGAAASLLLLVFQTSALPVYALLLGICCAFMYGVNPLETVVIPMEYAAYGRVGFAAGIIDSFIYLGSALVSVSSGWMKETFGASAVFTTWTIAAGIGAGAIALSHGAWKRTGLSNQPSPAESKG